MIFYFSIGACIPKCDFSQLSHIDELLEHYRLHQDEANKAGSKISFGEFLYIHFIEGDEHQHPNENEHQNLPLYSVSSGIVLFLSDNTSEFTSVPSILEEREITFFNALYFSSFINKVFHPPCLFH